jgi:hypothetical protein
MAASYDDSVAELFQAPHAEFVVTRKRLAGVLKDAGDKAGAARLGKLNRPPISAWAVNQLWWQARDAFDRLLETAARLRDGDLAGTAAHREALTALRVRAGAVLAAAGHAATEATLRRITTTLSAIAATGDFAPDAPGALTDDRDPPGFEAAGIPGLAASVAPAAPSAAAQPAPIADHTAAEAAAAKQRAADEAAAKRRADEAAAKKAAERHRAEAALRTARGDVERRERELERLQKAVGDAEAALDKARAIVTDLEAQLDPT